MNDFNTRIDLVSSIASYEADIWPRSAEQPPGPTRPGGPALLNYTYTYSYVHAQAIPGWVTDARLKDTYQKAHLGFPNTPSVNDPHGEAREGVR